MLIVAITDQLHTKVISVSDENSALPLLAHSHKDCCHAISHAVLQLEEQRCELAHRLWIIMLCSVVQRQFSVTNM